MVFPLVIPVALTVLGFLIGRWWLLALTALYWIAGGIYVIFNNGWYGAGWGEGGVLVTILLALVSMMATWIGVAVHKVLRE